MVCFCFFFFTPKQRMKGIKVWLTQKNGHGSVVVGILASDPMVGGLKPGLCRCVASSNKTLYSTLSLSTLVLVVALSTR